MFRGSLEAVKEGEAFKKVDNTKEGLYNSANSQYVKEVYM